MKCPHCKVEIACRCTVCPLCHVPFNNSEGALDAAKRLPRAFPPKGKAPFLATSRFDKIYLAVAANLAVLSFLLEFLITGRIKASVLIAALLFYIYFSIRFTIQHTGYFSQKVTAQTLALTLIIFFARRLMPRPMFVFEYLLPSLYILAMLIISIFILIKHKYPQHYLMNLLSIAALGLTPMLILIITKNCFYILSVYAAISAGIVILALFLFAWKNIRREFIRLFHL
jgi:hypothetical protein